MNYEIALSFQERVKICAKHAGDAIKLADLAGVSRRVIGKYLAGESDPSRERLVSIAKAADVNIAWLATGEGPMRKGDDIGVEFSTVARYDVEASCGDGSVVTEEPEIGRLAFRHAWLKEKGLKATQLAVIRIKGNSMAPTISNEALVMIDTKQDEFHDEGIYVLLYDGYLLAKRLQRDTANNGVLIKSDNKDYETQHLTMEQAAALRIIGRVIWIGQEV